MRRKEILGRWVLLIIVVLFIILAFFNVSFAQEENGGGRVFTILGVGGAALAILMAYVTGGVKAAIDKGVAEVQRYTPPHVDPWVKALGDAAKLMVDAADQNPDLETDEEKREFAVQGTQELIKASKGRKVSSQVALSAVEAELAKKRKAERETRERWAFDYAERLKATNPGRDFAELLELGRREYSRSVLKEELEVMELELEADNISLSG